MALRNAPVEYRGHIVLDTDEGVFVAPQEPGDPIPGDMDKYRLYRSMWKALDAIDKELTP